MTSVPAPRGEGVAIDGPHGPVRLKWHKLRRRPEDFAFDIGNLRRAMELGASVEVDLRRLADGGFVCLHDADLDGETTGTGPVGQADSRSVETLRMRHPVGGELGGAPRLLETVVHVLAGGGAHPGTVVQLDIKDDDPAPERALDRFAAALDGCAHWFIASGMSWPAVAALGEAVPGLRLGYDPLALAEELHPDGVVSFHEFLRRALAEAPRAVTVYLHHRLLADAVAAGVPIVELFRAEGRSVDCWTLDPDHESIETLLPLVLEAGVDQITTNGPLALEAHWQS